MTAVGNAPIRALLVDDDPMLLALLTAFMEARGYEVATSPDGQDALRQMERAAFNLVVTDRNMPRMDGLSLCRAIRAQAAESYVYSIMLTASDDESSLVEAMEAGVDDFLAKPLRPAELGARLRAAERVIALEAGLAERNRELGQALGQLSRDLELARALQLGQLPQPQSFGSLRFEGLFEASSFVGGDAYDYFAVGERHVAFYVADISGHGVAAAMMAVNAQHHLRAATQQVVAAMARSGAGPEAMASAVLAEANRRFLQMNESGLYLTVAYGLVDVAQRRVALVQAGHPSPLLAGPERVDFQPVGEGNVPIGILPDVQYEATVVPLSAGSRLVLYSDGITDCDRGDGELFGELRLQQVLRALRRSTAPEACAAVRDSLHAWHPGSFDDDVTMLVVESH